MNISAAADPRVYDLRNALEDALRQIRDLKDRLRITNAELRAARNNNESVAALLALSSHNRGGAYCSVCHSHETANDR